MKYLILIAALVGGGYYYHKNMSGDSFSEPAQAYVDFANDMFHARFDKARKRVLYSESLDEIERRELRYQFANDRGERGTIGKITHTIKSEELSSDKKTANINIGTTIKCGPKQAVTRMTYDTIFYEHRVELVKEARGWMIQSFELWLTDPKPENGANHVGFY